MAVQSRYEEWKTRYRETHGQPDSDDTDIYVAFAAPSGVASELIFVGEDPEADDSARRQQLLELSASALADFKPTRPTDASAVVEVRRKRRGRQVFVGWMGAPEDGPLIPASDLVARAIADVEEQLRVS